MTQFMQQYKLSQMMRDPVSDTRLMATIIVMNGSELRNQIAF